MSAFDLKMYMKVKGVRGGVRTPVALSGAIEIFHLTWPASTFRRGLGSTTPLEIAPRAQDFPDFPSAAAQGNRVEVTAISGSHSPQLDMLAFAQVSAALTHATRPSDLNVELWITTANTRFLRGVLTSVTFDTEKYRAYGSWDTFRFRAAFGRMRAV